MIDDDLVVAGQSADEPQNDAPNQQQRDEGGKFAGKQPETQAPETQAAEEIKGRQIPIQALDAEKARRRKAEQEAFQLRGYLQALQGQQKSNQPQEPAKPLPDWYSDPEAAFKARLEPTLQKLQEQLQQQGAAPRQVAEQTSRMIAEDKYGPEAVSTAYQAADEAMSTNPAVKAMLQARLNASQHPYGELVKWHKEQAALSRVGDDPDAFIEAEVQRRLAEAGGQQQQPPGLAQSRAPAHPMPSNFANSRNAGGRSTPAWGGPKPLGELFGGR